MDLELSNRVKNVLNKLNRPIAVSPSLVECVTCWEALALSEERNDGRVPRVVRNEIMDRLDLAQAKLTADQSSWFGGYQLYGS